MYILGLIAVIVILGTIEYSIRFSINPIIKQIYLPTKGCLIYDLDEDKYEIVDVLVVGENHDYLFNNKLSSIYANILIDGYSITSQKYLSYDQNKPFEKYYGFFASEFHDKSNYATIEMHHEQEICRIIVVSKSLDMLVCGIVIDEHSDDNAKEIINGNAILVIPADNLEKAKELIDESNSYSPSVNEWMKEKNLVN